MRSQLSLSRSLLEIRVVSEGIIPASALLGKPPGFVFGLVVRCLDAQGRVWRRGSRRCFPRVCPPGRFLLVQQNSPHLKCTAQVSRTKEAAGWLLCCAVLLYFFNLFSATYGVGMMRFFCCTSQVCGAGAHGLLWPPQTPACGV